MEQGAEDIRRRNWCRGSSKVILIEIAFCFTLYFIKTAKSKKREKNGAITSTKIYNYSVKSHKRHRELKTTHSSPL